MKRLWRRLIRLLGFSVIAMAIGPPAIIAVFAVINPPVTPLMLIRWHDGAAIERSWRPLAEMSPHLAHAVIAAEDNRFCSHWGFDVDASLSEVEAWLDGQRPRGASTITMQTAKNLFLWPERSVWRKLIEAWLTPQIELLWSKQRILEVYLNIIEFESGVYGAEAAARHHFDASAASLGPRQSALLAAVLPDPRGWSASKPSAFVQNRARIIQRRVGELGPLLACSRRQH